MPSPSWWHPRWTAFKCPIPPFSNVVGCPRSHSIYFVVAVKTDVTLVFLVGHLAAQICRFISWLGPEKTAYSTRKAKLLTLGRYPLHPLNSCA
uniref:Secreted protein n=1 Tax=Panagrellus redivivus TaxID=6233 RepID=A0A7E4UQA6_PANRE